MSTVNQGLCVISMLEYNALLLLIVLLIDTYMIHDAVINSIIALNHIRGN